MPMVVSMRTPILTALVALITLGAASASTPWVMSACTSPGSTLAHGGGLNACGCHFNRKTGECHCHQARGCGCACQPTRCG